MELEEKKQALADAQQSLAKAIKLALADAQQSLAKGMAEHAKQSSGYSDALAQEINNIYDRIDDLQRDVNTLKNRQAGTRPW